jgi:hypothetical protein
MGLAQWEHGLHCLAGPIGCGPTKYTHAYTYMLDFLAKTLTIIFQEIPSSHLYRVRPCTGTLKPERIAGVC